MKPIMQENDRVGFVGIGYMGRPIARRLLESGFKVTAYDRDRSNGEELIQYGGSVGPSGSGATMKLVVNSLLGIGMQAIAEAVALGEKAGLDRNRLLDVLSQTAVVAQAHVGKLERAMKSDYSPQFPIRLMNKDFGLTRP